MDLILCNGSDLLKLSSTFVRIRTFVADFGNYTKVPAAASVFQGTTGWREGGEQDTLSGASMCCPAPFLSGCFFPVDRKPSSSAILKSDLKSAE